MREEERIAAGRRPPGEPGDRKERRRQREDRQTAHRRCPIGLSGEPPGAERHHRQRQPGVVAGDRGQRRQQTGDGKGAQPPRFAWTQRGFARLRPSREGAGTLRGFPRLIERGQEALERGHPEEKIERLTGGGGRRLQMERRDRQRERGQRRARPAHQPAREGEKREEDGQAAEQRQITRRARGVAVERDERAHQHRVQGAELAVGARDGGARRIEHHPLGDERAHRRVAMLVLREREEADAQHDRQDKDQECAGALPRRRLPRGRLPRRRGQFPARAARTRGRAASISASETAPTEIRNQPLSSRRPNA